MNDPSRKARLASPEPRLLQMAGLPALILAFSCVGGADGPPPLARFGPHTLNVDEVTELVVPVENVPADVNTVAAIAVTWADFIALADLLTEDSVLTSLDFDAAVVPVVNQEMISALRELEFPLDTVVTDDELVEAYEQTDPPVRLSASHILLRYPPNATDAYRDRVRDGANEILARLRAGEGFARLAISFSEDPGSAPLGGDLGEFSPGEMLPALDSALGGLNEGDVGGPVETDLGLHLVRLDRRTVLGLGDARDDLRASILLRRRLQSDSLLVASAEGGTVPEVVEGAVELVREIAVRPARELSGRAARRVIATHPLGDLELGEARSALLREGIGFAGQVATGTSEEVTNFLVGLLRRDLLVGRARKAGLAPSQARVEEMRGDARAELLAAARSLRLHRLDAAPGEPKRQAVARTAREAVERVLLGATGALVLGPMSEEVRRGRTLILEESALGSAVVAIASARMNRSASPLEQSFDTTGSGS